MLPILNSAWNARRTISLARCLLPALFLLCFVVFIAPPAYAGTAQTTDKLVQCGSSGTMTNYNAIAGINLPNIQFDSTGHFYAKSVDVAIFAGTGSTPVKELDGFKTNKLKVDLGAVTNYDYNAGSPVVYEIKFRGHYGLVGQTVQDITEEWKSTGLYFTVWRQAPATTSVTTGGYSVLSKAITGFSVPNQAGFSFIDTINHTVTFHMPYGSDVSALTPAITVSSSAKVNPASVTAQDFSSPVSYTVTAQDWSTQVWKATCVVDPAPAVPELVSAATDTTGTKITLQFNKAMADPQGNQSHFTVMAGQAQLPVKAVTLEQNTACIDLTLDPEPVIYGNQVKLSYAPGTVSSKDGALLPALNAQPVTNNVPSNNALLSSLSLSSVSAQALNFSYWVNDYSVSVDDSVYSTTVSAITMDSHATMTVNGKELTSGGTTQPIPLNVGDNTITVDVIAQDGRTKQRYTITVTRQ